MECPTCRAPYQPGDRFCGSCGERLGGAAAPVAAPAAPPNPWGAPPSGPPPGPFGAPPVEQPLRPGVAPTQFGGAGGQMSCPTCSAPVEPGDTTCLVCGTDLTRAAVAAVAAPPAPPPPPAPAPASPFTA